VPSRYGNLPLDDAPRTLVFRAIDDLIRADGTMQRIFRGNIRSWRGDPNDKAELAIGMAPAIRLTPAPGPVSYWYPGATKGNLFIDIELIVKGLRIDDVENLWFAIERVVMPRETVPLMAVHAALTAAGAMTGLIYFTSPAHDPNPTAGDGGAFRPYGQMSLEVKTS
jgi:hypothetical protein